jgi:hypothetical protein
VFCRERSERHRIAPRGMPRGAVAGEFEDVAEDVSEPCVGQKLNFWGSLIGTTQEPGFGALAGDGRAFWWCTCASLSPRWPGDGPQEEREKSRKTLPVERREAEHLTS